MSIRAFTLTVALAASLTLQCQAPSVAEPSAHLMVLHCALYSLITRQRTIVEPDLSIRDNGVLREAQASDDPGAAALSKAGTGLGFTLGTWFGARGTLLFDAALARPQIATAFAGLIPRGHYGLYQFKVSGITESRLMPLDGSGAANAFTADAAGNAQLFVTSPNRLSRGDGIVLVYRTPAAAARPTAGAPGVDAFEQLVFELQ